MENRLGPGLVFTTGDAELLQQGGKMAGVRVLGSYMEKGRRAWEEAWDSKVVDGVAGGL